MSRDRQKRLRKPYGHVGDVGDDGVGQDLIESFHRVPSGHQPGKFLRIKDEKTMKI
jgi:hypothetical protein